MNEIIAKLKGILTEEDLTKLENLMKRMISESVEEKVSKAKSEMAVLQEEFINKQVEEKLVTEKALLEESYNLKYESFENNIKEKLSLFLEAEVSTKISDEMVSKIAMNEIYEPVINGIMNVLEEKYVAVDAEGYKMMADAKEEIERLEKVISGTVQEKMTLTEQNNSLKAKLLIEEKTFGLNEEQKKQVTMMFESKGFDDITKGIDSFIDNVIEADVTINDNKQTTILAEGEDVALDIEHELREEKNTMVEKAAKLM
jgi:hypothetical protein